LAAIVRLAEDLCAADEAMDLPAYVTVLAERMAAQHPPTVDGVTLASLHAAKGMEWDAVFLIGLVDGTVPIAHAVTPSQVDEERRLLYVGVTRARRHLALSWAAARSPGGRGSRSPSRFLDGLIDGVPGADRAVARGSGKRRRTPARCRVCGKPLLAALDIKLGRCDACPSDLDEALFERLRTWRKERATAAGKPAFTVFTDATLTVIAERRPTDRDALLAISGVGPAKFREYGDEVLALCGAASVSPHLLS
jgi:DNA helicase-2/ATP-dependent DNA helicase PcrA